MLVGPIMVTFESIFHHGTRHLLGEADQEVVGSKVDKIRTVHDFWQDAMSSHSCAAELSGGSVRRPDILRTGCAAG